MKSSVSWKVATTSHLFVITPVVLRLEADQGRGRYIRFYMKFYIILTKQTTRHIFYYPTTKYIINRILNCVSQIS